MISIVTVARSGSYLLQSYLLQRYSLTQEDIEKTHKLLVNDNPLKVSIVRNPYESISSMMAMEAEFYPERTIDEICERRIKKYISFYEYLLTNFDGIIFSYDALLTVPESVLLAIENSFGISKKNNNILISTLVASDIKGNHTVSSKNLRSMKYVKQKLDRVDLSECFKLYKEVLKKVII
jgi:hypothetical protein